MSKASKIRLAKIKSASTPPDVSNRNKSSKPQGVESEKNAIADSIKSAVESYRFVRQMEDFKQEMIVGSAFGNYGKDDYLLSKEFKSGYSSVIGVDKKSDYDAPDLRRVSEGVIVEQNPETGKVKKVKDKNYYKD